MTEQYPDQILATPAELEQLAAVIAGSERLVVFTGAGISTESGIPDYRGPNGVWARNAIPHIDNVRTDGDAQREMWEFRRKRYPEMLAKQPNRGHMAIANLERDGKLLAIITQNIDGLHQKAGNSPERVIELHGSTHRLRCQNCGREYDGEAIQARLDAGEADPRCVVCGGPLRPSTILFGESLPPDALRAAVAVAQAADVMLVVGSSLAVNPAARLPQIARKEGAKIVIVNRTPTPLDRIADLRILADAGSTLSNAYDLLRTRAEVSNQ
jgi:NAD-dependent deacetylase